MISSSLKYEPSKAIEGREHFYNLYRDIHSNAEALKKYEKITEEFFKSIEVLKNKMSHRRVSEITYDFNSHSFSGTKLASHQEICEAHFPFIIKEFVSGIISLDPNNKVQIQAESIIQFICKKFSSIIFGSSNGDQKIRKNHDFFYERFLQKKIVSNIEKEEARKKILFNELQEINDDLLQEIRADDGIDRPSALEKIKVFKKELREFQGEVLGLGKKHRAEKLKALENTEKAINEILQMSPEKILDNLLEIYIPCDDRFFTQDMLNKLNLIKKPLYDLKTLARLKHHRIEDLKSKKIEIEKKLNIQPVVQEVSEETEKKEITETFKLEKKDNNVTIANAHADVTNVLEKNKQPSKANPQYKVEKPVSAFRKFLNCIAAPFIWIGRCFAHLWKKLFS